jgi:hypothetical protein
MKNIDIIESHIFDNNNTLLLICDTDSINNIKYYRILFNIQQWIFYCIYCNKSTNCYCCDSNEGYWNNSSIYNGKRYYIFCTLCNFDIINKIYKYIVSNYEVISSLNRIELSNWFKLNFYIFLKQYFYEDYMCVYSFLEYLIKLKVFNKYFFNKLKKKFKYTVNYQLRIDFTNYPSQIVIHNVKNNDIRLEYNLNNNDLSNIKSLKNKCSEVLLYTNYLKKDLRYKKKFIFSDKLDDINLFRYIGLLDNYYQYNNIFSDLLNNICLSNKNIVYGNNYTKNDLLHVKDTYDKLNNIYDIFNEEY